MQMIFDIDGNIVKKLKIIGGCPGNTVGVSKLIEGKTIDEALKVTNKDVLKLLGELPPHKIHCSLMAEESIRAAIEDYYKRREKEIKKGSKKNA